jgi:hypothetical protein
LSVSRAAAPSEAGEAHVSRRQLRRRFAVRAFAWTVLAVLSLGLLRGTRVSEAKDAIFVWATMGRVQLARDAAP